MWRGLGIETSEMRFLRQVKGCTILDKIRSEAIREELEVLPLINKIKEYRIRWSQHLHRMSSDRIPKQIYHYRPRGKRDVGRPRLRWQAEDGTGDPPNP